MSNTESEPTISRFALEMIDATHQQTIAEMADAHKHTVDVLWKVIIILGLLLLISFVIIGYGVWMWNQYDTISYEQDGNGNNIIGDENRSYYYEPEIEEKGAEE